MTQYLDLRDIETHLGRKIRQAEKALDALVVAKYKALTEDEVKPWWWMPSGWRP